MKRREFLKAGAAAPALLGAAPARRPNVLLILTDDQGYGDLGCHGNPHLKTPNLDRLAREGAEFTQFHASPVCTPTRSSLMTGRYNYRTRAIDTYLGRAMMDPAEVTVAEAFSAAGYRTGIFGKWHLGDNYPMRAMDQGFEESLVHQGGGLAQPAGHPDGYHYFDPMLRHNGVWERHKGYCTDIFAGACERFIAAGRGKPFFAYLAANAPHTPPEVEESWVAPYRAAGIDDATARIFGMIANLDAAVGRVLGRLKELDIERDTIVVFMTDNGPQQERYNAGMRGLKGTPYEGGIRVPCFFRWKGAVRPRVIDRLAAHIDMMPTLLDMCGVPAPSGVRLDGRSLWPLVRGDNVDWPDRTLNFQWHRGDEPRLYENSAARSQRYKLVNGKELYDLVSDPGERNDIAAAKPDVAARMRKDYEDWFRDVSSTRGYDPPRPVIGTAHEDPVTLTRQDWRGPRAGWAENSLGYWEVEIASPGPYQVTLRFPKAAAAGEAIFQVGDVNLRQTVAPGAQTAVFEGVKLGTGKSRIEPALKFGAETVGVHYVDLKLI
jgi:arylsulfatase A-like enzyme